MLPLTPFGQLLILVYLVNTAASVLAFLHFVVVLLVQPAAMFQVS
jgi:hypothetical protein